MNSTTLNSIIAVISLLYMSEYYILEQRSIYIMEAFFTIINVVVLIIFIIMLNIMARKHVSFPKRVFTALGIGIVLE